MATQLLDSYMERKRFEAQIISLAVWGRLPKREGVAEDQMTDTELQLAGIDVVGA